LARIMFTEPDTVNTFFAYLLLTYDLLAEIPAITPPAAAALLTFSHFPADLIVASLDALAHAFIELRDFFYLYPVLPG